MPRVKVADVDFNLSETERLIAQAEGRGVEIVCFPELGLTGYTCQDLFLSRLLLDKAKEALDSLVEYSRNLDIISIVGMPVEAGGMLLNCAVVVQKGHVLGVVPKKFLPNYGEFYEKRWFASSLELRDTQVTLGGEKVVVTSEPQVFLTADGVGFGIEICEDVWSPVPPSCNLALTGAEIIFNLSASDELTGKHAYLKGLLAQQSARLMCGYVYSGCGYGESTQDVVYGGNAIIHENGRLMCESERFSLDPKLETAQLDVELLRAERRANTTFVCSQTGASARTVEAFAVGNRPFELMRDIDPLPFIPKSKDMKSGCQEILDIQTMGLAKRLDHTKAAKAVVGISGGLDSTLALLVAVRAFDKLKLNRKDIVGITMPGFGTTGRTHDNALSLMESLGVTVCEISIVPGVTQHFKDIDHSLDVHDVTYENGQARERTQILMDYANKVGGLVIGTGDLSELALGWATYNGDHMSMYGVNAGVPKTLIRHLVNYIAVAEADETSRKTLLDIIDTPISPELIPADENGEISQKTEDLVGPYELHDFFLYHYLRFGFRPSKIFAMAKRAFDGSHPGVAAYGSDVIKHWLRTFFRRFFAQQFKRSCLPDGPKVGSVCLSPRGDWRMASDSSAAIWLDECDKL